ncbi:cilia- and flagella-associated protein 58-like isoform X2 [Anticarsia gemmatalis]|uniref:cilia- and flagella-associated protein 58-like isoform X2 n=1 Tax=Anticarsia gemmatalis TaxID=129554 RepID=UPI003F75AEC8
MDPDEEETFGAAMNIGSETTEAEKEYEKVLEQLRELEGMKFYSDVYTKLYDSYFKMKEEKAVNVEENIVLKQKMRRFDDTVNDYLQEIADANKTIEKLRADIDEARALADAMHARELAGVESLETIKKLVTRLEKELDARKRAGDDDAGATSAVKEKEKFEKEKARLNSELDGVKQRLTNALGYVEELENKNTMAEENIAKLEEQLEEADNNAVRQNRLVDHLKGETNTMKAEVEARGVTIKNLTDKVARGEKTLERRDRQLASMMKKLDLAQAEQEQAVNKAAQLRDSLDSLHAEYEKMKGTLTNTARELKNAMDEGTKQRNEVVKLTKQAIQQTKKFQLLEQTKANIESEREGLRQQVAIMERDLQLGNKQAEADRREIENLNREKDILNKNMQKIQNEALDNLHMLHLQEQRRKQLEHELDVNAAQINKQRLLIRQYEKDKDRTLEETIALNEKIDEISEEVRLRTADILDLKKALREENINSRKLSVALDATRAERNMLHKNYTEALDEIQDLKQKLKMLAYQIEQLKEDISGKEVGLKTCEGVLAKCNKKNEQLRSEVQAGQVKLSEARADIAALRQEEARLNRIVQEGDTARAKLLKELEGLMNERDVVGAQLVRRNDEISLLYEKIRILEITLQRGERQYEQRVEDIRLLRLEIIRLRKEKNLLSKGIENMTDLRLEVFNLEREVGRERLRVRALEEALETPLNVHRWRKLQGTDPEAVRLTQKLRLTQKKVLAQSEMLVLKDRELKETKNLYSAVKDMLALQPSPEIQITLNRTQRALTQRTSKMKCLIAGITKYA